MQRHYVMYYEMSYGLNIEMHKQAEIVKRLNGICAQVLPYLSQEHQQQVLGAIERAKQVTAPELNSIIRVRGACVRGLGGGGLVLVPWASVAELRPRGMAAPRAGTALLAWAGFSQALRDVAWLCGGCGLLPHPTGCKERLWFGAGSAAAPGCENTICSWSRLGGV
uniref:TLE family member 5, transcriptional modulator n=2 Tax=Anas platyrhynchos TaxID=8839 RepID=A0A493TSA8_ANAPP